VGISMLDILMDGSSQIAEGVSLEGSNWDNLPKRDGMINPAPRSAQGECTV